ncbi:hypothetical protein ACHWQZ_G017811 [Mnemiopsis leidyi]
MDGPMERIELSVTVKRVLASWSILTILLSIPGNAVVLIASLKHKAIKFDKVSVILIENIALSDLCDVLFVVLPTTIAILTEQSAIEKFFRENKFGQVVCYSVAHFQYLFPLASSVMICALNISKLLCLVSPLQSHTRPPTMGRLIAVAAWSAYLVRYLATLIIHDKAIYGYWEKGFRCHENDDTGSLILVDTVMGMLTVGLPGLILMITLSFLLYNVHKVAGLQKQAVLVNILISCAFSISFAPYIIREIWVARGVSPNSQAHVVCTWLWLAAIFLNYISCFANPIILYLSSASFKSFIDEKCCRVMVTVKNIAPTPRCLWPVPEDTATQEPLLRDPEIF